MTSVAEHYDRVLSPVYSWMAGGAAAALDAGAAEIASLALNLPADAQVADLGAGFGMHAIPLARAGARVVAIDSSELLLAELKKLAGDLPIAASCDDLLNFRDHLDGQPAVVLCLGDTLTHLPEHTNVDFLVQEVAEVLAPGGRFVISFRDYSEPLTDLARFIPVRSDERRILTCFLEYDDDTVLVHDILHERAGDDWETRVSSYRKLRLSPERVIGSLETLGFVTRREAGPRGMVRIVATLD
ncbi:MAG TPA: class I SAM-dependent methyltransferase [Steroidobacteraceae bacterium]|nr:class I SAM-dependent methyltransferase [Steroidobacteraceae bacterium]